MAGAIPDHVFEQARQQFAEAGRCIPNEQRDFTEWHLGRPCYALWAARLDHAPVKAAVLEAARHLDGLLLADYQRQPHVTLALGGFPAGQPALRDDFGRSALESQLAALVTSAPAPFQLEIGPLASFASAPFLCARDVEGGLGQLRRLLHPAGDTPDHSYTPHVTVGLYAGPWAVEDVMPRLDKHAASPLRCQVEQISLLGYAPSVIGGPLHTLLEFDLGLRRMRWHTPWPVQAAR